MLDTQLQELGEVSEFLGAGIYVLYYDGPHELYQSIAGTATPIYVGKAVPRGARKARTDARAIGKELWGRIDEHRESTAYARDLEPADFRARYLVTDELFIPLAERLMIRSFTPVWNVVVDGFGNHDPGGGRYDQRCRPGTPCIQAGLGWCGCGNPASSPARRSRPWSGLISSRAQGSPPKRACRPFRLNPQRCLKPRGCSTLSAKTAITWMRRVRSDLSSGVSLGHRQVSVSRAGQKLIERLAVYLGTSALSGQRPNCRLALRTPCHVDRTGRCTTLGTFGVLATLFTIPAEMFSRDDVEQHVADASRRTRRYSPSRPSKPATRRSSSAGRTPGTSPAPSGADASGVCSNDSLGTGTMSAAATWLSFVSDFASRRRVVWPSHVTATVGRRQTRHIRIRYPTPLQTLAPILNYQG